MPNSQPRRTCSDPDMFQTGTKKGWSSATKPNKTDLYTRLHQWSSEARLQGWDKPPALALAPLQPHRPSVEDKSVYPLGSSGAISESHTLIYRVSWPSLTAVGCRLQESAMSLLHREGISHLREEREEGYSQQVVWSPPNKHLPHAL